MGVFGNGYINKRIDLVAEATIELENEMTSFNRLFDAIEVMNENSIILEFSFKDIIEKIKELWHKFTAWVKRIWDKIFHRNKVASNNIDEAKKNTEEVAKKIESIPAEHIENVRNSVNPLDISPEAKQEARKAENLDQVIDIIKKDVNKRSESMKHANDKDFKEMSENIDKLLFSVETTDPVTKEKKTKVCVPKVTKEEKLHDITLKTFKFDFLVTVHDSFEDLKFEPDDIFGFNNMIEHDAKYNIRLAKDKVNDELDERHLNAVTFTGDGNDSHIIDNFNHIEVIGRGKNQIKSTEKEYAGTYFQILSMYNKDQNSKDFEDAIKEYQNYIERINESINKVEKILNSGEDNIKNYIRETFKKIHKDNFKPGYEPEQTDEEIENFVNKVIGRVPTIISKDIARGQKIIGILTSAISSCNAILDKYTAEYNKLTALGAKPLN